MSLIIKIGTLFFRVVYAVLKLFKTKKKVTFISRQSDSISIDFKLIVDSLKNENVEIVVLTKKLKSDDNLLKKIKYSFHIFRQMYHIASSKVVVLDGYCIPISILNHKNELKVIQVWHALGSLKKFGLSIQDKQEGSSKELSNNMHMHKNYDYILTSSKASLPNSIEAFGYSDKFFKIIPLPRVDLLNDSEYQYKTKKKIEETYPVLKNKQNILYAPTFRYVEDEKAINDFINIIDYDKYNLILKLHPLSNVDIKNSKILKDEKYSTLDMLFISDYIVTDYSAIAFEAAFLKKPLFFYTYDIATYVNKRDFYIDYKKEMPGIISDDPKVIIKGITNNKFDLDKIERFSKKYIEYDGNSVKKIVNLIMQNMI